jgi:Ni,Fe-hydrogenase maturation factor
MVDRVLVVGCTPERLEDGIGLSETVEAALDTAASMVLDVVRRESSRITA